MAAATPTMYSKEESQYSQRAVAVPGTVRGLEMARRRFGTMSWSQLIQPAIALARDGFIVDEALAKSTNDTLASSPDLAELQFTSRCTRCQSGFLQTECDYV